jgi:hypothetical protein
MHGCTAVQGSVTLPYFLGRRPSKRLVGDRNLPQLWHVADSGGSMYNLWGHPAPQVLIKLVEFYCSVYDLVPQLLLAGPTGFESWIRHWSRTQRTPVVYLPRQNRPQLRWLNSSPQLRRSRSSGTGKRALNMSSNSL